MSDAQIPFGFSHLVPGFEFLKNLSAGAGVLGSGSGSLPGLSSWVAPTLSVEEVDRRIQELKTVQYWLEQNGHALKATIQALEVQKMTLSTLRGMNVRMEDLAQAFTRQATDMGAAMKGTTATRAGEDSGTTANLFASRPTRASSEDSAPADDAGEESSADAEGDEGEDGGQEGAAAQAGSAGGLVDPLQWWGALTQQFQQIASSAMKEATQMRVPDMAEAVKTMSSFADGALGAAGGASSAPGSSKEGSKGAKGSSGSRSRESSSASGRAARTAPARRAGSQAESSQPQPGVGLGTAGRSGASAGSASQRRDATASGSDDGGTRAAGSSKNGPANLKGATAGGSAKRTSASRGKSSRSAGGAGKTDGKARPR